jgi:imidazolonepropionase-like amidohydrolase
LPRSAYFALAEEAKMLRISFGGHTPASISAAEAAEAGQKSIEHLSQVWEGCCANNGKAWVYDEGKASALLNLFKKNNTWHCPTFVVRIGSYRDISDITNDVRSRYISKAVQTRAYWHEARADSSEQRALFQQKLKLAARMQREGIGLLAGTDAIMPFVYPGFSLHDELALFVQAGLTPLAALQTATLNPARFLGRENFMGTVEKGKLADLVLLDANPLTDIANTKRISAVIANGHLFKRAALDQILLDVEKKARVVRPPSSSAR